MGIVVENLNFSYPEKKVLKNINFEICDGDFIGLTGTTGSGKTTLSYCLNGLIPNSIKGKFSGSVVIDDLSTKKYKVSEIAKKVGLIFQNPDWQIFALSVKEEVAFGPENLKLDNIEKRVKRALKDVGLSGFEDKDPQKLSQGQKQKLCIASVLAMNPGFIVLDEPTSHLDYKNSKIIYKVLKNLNKKGKTILVIDHKTDFLAKYTKKVMIMDDGKILRYGDSKKILSEKKFLENLGIQPVIR